MVTPWPLRPPERAISTLPSPTPYWSLALRQRPDRDLYRHLRRPNLLSGNHAYNTCHGNRGDGHITAVRKASANTEAAKITGFTAGTNTASSLVFTPTVSSALDGNATVNFVSVKTGQNATDAILTDWGASGLSLNTQKVVDNGNYTYVEVTFTVTLNGVTSDERPLAISGLFASGTTAGKLRTDNAKFPRNSSVIGSYTFTNGTSLNTYYSFSPAVPLSNGVAFSPVAGSISGGGLDINANQLSLKADAGGDIRIAFAMAPTRNGNCRWQFSNIVLTCDGTRYSCSGIDFLVDIWVP